jgi:phosphopantetheinyl transferase (holo-ACP synthase)
VISTGNDIVAMGSVNKQRTNQFRFYSKILSATEQSLYHQPEFADLPFESYVWLLWSVKEAAYKYLKRTTPGLIFSPTKIIITHIDLPLCQLMNKLEGMQWEGSVYDEELYAGKVQFGSDILYFQAKVTVDWISSVVNSRESFENVYWGVQSINDTAYEHQSKAVRAFLLNRLDPFFTGDLLVGKSPAGYPVIIQNAEALSIPVSLAHDGCFVAYSFII